MIGPVGGGDLGFLAGGSILAVIIQQAWSRFFTKEGKGNDALVGQLTDRIVNLEERQAKQEVDIDIEREQRRKAEDEVHALRLEAAKQRAEIAEQRAEMVRQITALELDNMALRAELLRHGITVQPAAVAPAFVMKPPA